MIAPIAIGRDARDIARLSHELQQALHLFGRYGITIFALSGLDIALWDIAGKAAGLPLHRLLGGAGQAHAAGLCQPAAVRDPERVADAHQAGDRRRATATSSCTRPRSAEVRAAREAAGEGLPIMVDTNCPWTPEQARHMAAEAAALRPALARGADLPARGLPAIARLRAGTGVPMAAGENDCTSFQFRDMFAAGAVDYAQPSVTKVGGVTEFLKVAALADAAGVTRDAALALFRAGLPRHPASARGARPRRARWSSAIHMDLEASLYGELVDPVGGVCRVPDGPGLGRDPDPDVIRDYRVAA